MDARSIVEKAYVAGRQAYALSHALERLTGDSRFRARYDVPDQLRLHGGGAAETFLWSMGGRPLPVPTPWAADLARLAELMGPRESKIGNGG